MVLAICAVCYYGERTAEVTGIAVHSPQLLYITFHSSQRTKPIHQPLITLPGWKYAWKSHRCRFL
jgi:hypothetical protein